MEELKSEGKIRSIGVSNFKKYHLVKLLGKSSIVPAINQIEFNPLMQDNEVLEYCKAMGIVIEAWSPLGQGTSLNLDEIKKIATKHKKTPAQTILRWLNQKGIVVLPKSVHEKRIVENRSLFDFELPFEDLRIIDNLNLNQRMGPDPDNFDF